MERGSQGIAAPDPFEELSRWSGHKSDDGDDNSHASTNFDSCEESEFDRYCSANSVLGSASICSSAGNRGEFLDSFRSFGPGEEYLSEGSSVRERPWRNRRNGDGDGLGRFDGLSDGESDLDREDGVTDLRLLLEGSGALPGMGKGSMLCPGLCENGDTTLSENEKLRLPSYGNAVESCSSAKTAGLADYHRFSKKLDFCTKGSISHGLLRAESAPDEDSSSRCEHSVDENLMLEYGADGHLEVTGSNLKTASRQCRGKAAYIGPPQTLRKREPRVLGTAFYGADGDDGISANWKGDVHFNWKDRPLKEDPLLISSSVAIDNDGLDDFVQETEVNALDYVSLYGDKYGKHEGSHFETEDNILELPYATSMDHFGSEKLEEVYVKDILEAGYEDPRFDKSSGQVTSCLIMNPLMENEPSIVQRPIGIAEASGYPDIYVVNKDEDTEKEVRCTSQRTFVNFNRDETAKIPAYAESKHSPTPQSNSLAFRVHHIPTKELQVKEIRHDVLSKVQKGHNSVPDMNVATNQVEEKNNISESYDEMVLEMEEILLESGESHSGRLLHGNQGCMSQKSYHIRDGSSTASTSGTNDVYMRSQYPLSIDWIEVVGSGQKEDVSFGERLVGVKEYTIYKLRVQSDKDQWEVERRYRDFFTLYRQLKAIFSDHGLTLPSPWTNVERESRNIFGNSSPNVISQRSTLIQECLCSVLNFRFLLGMPSPLICFLFPSKDSYSSGFLNPLYHSMQRVSADVKSNSSYCGEPCTEEISLLGKTISLVVEVKLRKSVGQLLESQHYMCAGCHRQLDAGKTRMQGLVQSFGWGRPRLCEYTGQLFCVTCHTNDTAVLPARVLHCWDFSLYSVSQLAKAYLDSIYDQPMLCVSAVNPFLFSKVPALLHIMGVRKKIASMLPYVHCPFRRSINIGLGSRRYLLENNEFFALRDLVDLSKGAFSALPTLVETVANKILNHIAQQCLVCYDSGVPCAAQRACNDPSSLIFPFQEDEAARCSSCHLLFHRPCISKMGSCRCGKLAPVDGRLYPTEHGIGGADIELDGFVDAQDENSDAKTLAGFFSDLMSKARPGNLWRHRSSNPVLLRGSSPGTTD